MENMVSYLLCTLTGEWLGEQPTNLPLNLRLAMHWRVYLSKGVAAECWAMWDLPAAFNMLRVNLFDRMDQQHLIIESGAQ